MHNKQTGYKIFKNMFLHLPLNVILFYSVISVSYEYGLNAYIASTLVLVFTCATAYSFIVNVWKIVSMRPTILQRVFTTLFVLVSFLSLNMIIIKFYFMK